MSIEESSFNTNPLQFEPDARVTDFLSASQNDNPLLYPGQRPETSYLTDGVNLCHINVANNQGVLDFSLKSDVGEISVNDYLSSNQLPTLDDRIPILAFGANMSPGSLASKFKKVGRSDALVIPTVYADLKGYDVVWSGGPGMNGNFVATLYSGEETVDSEAPVGVNFLTREQLLVMHATELNYQLASVEVAVAGVPVRAFYYVGQDSVYLENSKPVAIDSIYTKNRNLTTASTTTMLNQLFENTELMQEAIAAYPQLAGINAEGYIAFVNSIKATIGARTDLKQALQGIIAAAGQTKVVGGQVVLKDQASWANPSTLPTYGEQLQGIHHHDIYRLPSQEIPVWPDANARKKVLDSVGTHYRRQKDKP